MRTNYIKLGEKYVFLLKTFCFYLFRDINLKSLRISNDGFISFKEKGFPLFKKRIKRHISDFLIEDVTEQLSNILWGNFMYAEQLRLDINEIISKSYTDELTNTKLVIEYLYEYGLLSTPLRNFFGDPSEVYKLEPLDKIQITIDNINTNFPSNKPEVQEKGLTYVVDTFLFNLRNKVKTNIVSVALSFTLRVFPYRGNIDNLLNKINLSNILRGFYFSKSPPYEFQPYIYNST